jgi:hypothetical protein
MDLMKLLRHRTKETAKSGYQTSDGSQFLHKLADILRSDIAEICALQPEAAEEEILRLGRNMKVYVGNLNERATPEKDGYNYLFLNVPSKRGLMLELDPDQADIQMRHGTLIVPLKRNNFEELEQSTLFVTAPQVLYKFTTLSNDLIRENNENKTYSIEAMSELILAVAFGIREPEPAKPTLKDDNLV